MRIIRIVIGCVLLAVGILYSILSILSTIEMDPGNSSGEVVGHYIGQLLLFYGPSFLLLYFGYRLIRKKKPKKQVVPVQQPIPASYIPPVQHQVNTVINVVETKPTPPPVPKKTVSVECKGCGARKAVAAGESSPCDYCGSPLTA
ncbi:hypothetical protein D3P07_15465 [Paenibacillus sp. 1011MAR3C5]|uniref:hypothetical protein n=1 Tax=Paenibacillus sp. 1011MAR3C5 TaxID=1675787 RepID=UPI000E6BEB6E|nr:hypothetical protein [Paenibacillus sp. 1011MAR3C5]RJE87704.1 hypothetical protein D3P07_15465 [Paenibacillus sp. 1011MAR3C5]